jgi:hypothetical protein
VAVGRRRAGLARVGKEGGGGGIPAIMPSRGYLLLRSGGDKQEREGMSSSDAVGRIRRRHWLLHGRAVRWRGVGHGGQVEVV